MTATPIRCTSPADVVAHVTELLGYCPIDSLVILPLSGNSGAATLRLDLPGPDADRASLRSYSDAAFGYAMHVEDTDAVFCIVFVDEESRRAPRPEVIRALERAASRMGLFLHPPLFRTRAGWGSYRALPGFEAGHVRPATELGASGLLRPTPAPGATLDEGDDRHEDFDVADDAPRVPAAGYLSIVESLLEAEHARLHPLDAPEVLGSLVEALGFRSLRDEVLARIAFGALAPVAMPSLRDHVLLSAGSPRFDAAPLTEAFDYDRCERGLAILRAAARSAAQERRAGIYGAMSWLHWALGQGSLAAGWAARALQLNQGDGLARLIEAAAEQGVVAPWFGTPPRRSRAPHDAA